MTKMSIQSVRHKIQYDSTIFLRNFKHVIVILMFPIIFIFLKFSLLFLQLQKVKLVQNNQKYQVSDGKMKVESDSFSNFPYIFTLYI